jgi:Fic family protein
MLDIAKMEELSNLDAIKELSKIKEHLNSLDIPKSELLDIGNNMFTIGSKSHLNSLSPIIREELGLQLNFMTQQEPKLRQEYKTRKNKYISLGKSCSAINYLFDLVDEENFTPLDIVLMHELLMDDGDYRKSDVFITYPNGEKLTISSEGISDNVNKLFSWVHHLKEIGTISPIVLATIFHYFLVSIHPFNDGNGRVSRIFLNLILLKNELFPIIIPDIKRSEYYQSLINADNGSFENLVTLIANLSSNKLSEYIQLAEELYSLPKNIECLILTEDGNTDMIKSLLEFHNFNLETTAIESYEGKDNIASAVFLAQKLKAKSTTIKHIIFHRDRDNENIQSLRQQINKMIKNHDLKATSTLFITEGYDMESYFINAQHIEELFPHIRNAQEFINIATNNTEETSKKKLRIAYSQQNKFNIEDPLEEAKKIDKLYDDNPEKYRYGKAVLWELEELITKEIDANEKITLVQKSSVINIPEFTKAYKKLQL